MTRKIICDFCKKEIEKGDTFEVLDWTLHRFDLDLCSKCYDEIFDYIQIKSKEMNLR